MKIIKIDIIRSDIDKQLSKISIYTGVKSHSEVSTADIDRIATVDEDSDLLNRSWANAANVLADILKEFVVSFSLTENEISMTMEVSGSFDDSAAPRVTEGAKAFAVAFLAKDWFAITLPEKVSEWEAECSRLLAELSRSLYHRRRPVRITKK